jgi:radical SAM superfamily enzyme YgiQ (UPF0313 family)
VQYSRGCPFTCEFCDIIELYGRVPRTKTNDQILAELQALYDHGYRGHVDFVDDNFIGNKKNLRTLLPQLKAWLEERDYPFEFSTEASINIADDDDLLQAMKDTNFFAIFVGIESPDPEALVQMKKKQNTRRNIAECVHKIYGYGMFITAGFIVGFDTEKVSMGQAMIDFIEETNIPVCMVGLLYALPGTQLTRRLAKEGRLHNGHDLMKVEQAGDQCTLGCNFDTKRPLRDILVDYKAVLGHTRDGCHGSPSCLTAPTVAATCQMATCARGLAASTAYTRSCGSYRRFASRSGRPSWRSLRPIQARCVTS